MHISNIIKLEIVNRTLDLIHLANFSLALLLIADVYQLILNSKHILDRCDGWESRRCLGMEVWQRSHEQLDPVLPGSRRVGQQQALWDNKLSMYVLVRRWQVLLRLCVLCQQFISVRTSMYALNIEMKFQLIFLIFIVSKIKYNKIAKLWIGIPIFYIDYSKDRKISKFLYQTVSG